MQRAVHILAAVAVLIHVLGGCCWHHAHGAEAGRRAVRHEAPPCCGSHGEHDGPQPDGTPADDRACGVKHCVFAVPGSSSAGLGCPIVPEPLVARAPEPILADALPTALLAAVDGPRHPPDGSLRTHLLKQVLLL